MSVQPIKLFDPEAKPHGAGMQALDQALSERSQCSLLVVMGSARVGKSWLSSYILGQQGYFQSKVSVKPTTRGADAGVVGLNNVARRFGKHTNAPRDTGLVIADLEGKGHEGQDHDFRLLLPLMVCASGIIYLAQQGDTGRAKFLDEMHVCVRLCDSLQLSDKDDADDDDDTPCFGHLHVVVNGVTGDLEHAREELNSWMKPESLARKSPSEREAIRKRNEVRDILKLHFASVTFHPLPRPSTNFSWAEKDDGPFEDLSDAYKQEMSRAMGTLMPSFSNAHKLGDVAVTPRRLVSLLQKASAAAWDNDALSVPSAVAAIDEKLARQELKAALKDDCQRLEELRDSCTSDIQTRGSAAYSDSDVTTLLGNCVETALRNFEKKLQALGLMSSVQETIRSEFAAQLASKQKTVADAVREKLAARKAEEQQQQEQKKLAARLQKEQEESKRRSEELVRAKEERKRQERQQEETRRRLQQEEERRRKAERDAEEARQRQPPSDMLASQLASLALGSPAPSPSFAPGGFGSPVTPPPAPGPSGGVSPGSGSSFGGRATGTVTPTGLPLYTGPRGGQYHISRSGNRVYHSRR